MFIIALFTLGGFFLTFDSLGDMRNEVRDIRTSVELLSRAEEAPEPVYPSGEEPAGDSENGSQEPSNPVQGISIPTAILFDTTSSPALQPQVRLSVGIENVVKTPDGTVVVNFRIYTSKASGYTALNISDIFQVIFLDGEDMRPSSVTGSFQSIPPKSMVLGSVEFSLSPDADSVILQAGPLESARFYTFDFSRETYKETPLG